MIYSMRMLMTYVLVWIIWCEVLVWNFDDKNYDFDRVVLFVDFILLKSVDFTGVLSDFLTVIFDSLLDEILLI